MLTLAVLLLLVLLVGLFLFGALGSEGKNIYSTLDIQLDVFEKDVTRHFDSLAGATVQLSETVSNRILTFCEEQEIVFSDLVDRGDLIAALQDRVIVDLRQTLLQESCSGVLVLFDTTVNRTVTHAEKSRAGLYLQVSGYDTSDSEVLLFRGMSEIGKRYGMMPHRKWRLEFHTDLFPNYTEILAQTEPASESYRISDVTVLAGTSDRVLLLTAPIYGADGTVCGICGFEISASYFMTQHAQSSKIEHLTCLLTPNGGKTLDTVGGLSCGVTNGYYRAPDENLTVRDFRDNLSLFEGNGSAYVGITRNVSLSSENEPFALTVMMPKQEYDRVVGAHWLKVALLGALLLFVTVTCCSYFSHRYLCPILNGLEQLKSEKRSEERSRIPEINDLFVFLEERDRKYEEILHGLEREKRFAQAEKDRLQLAYTRALNEYETAQSEYEKAQYDLQRAQNEVDRLAYSRKTEIDPDDYQMFLDGMATLTKTEREIFEQYLAGKSAKEIMEDAGIKESTLKYHNHNILGKLGVSSRKQMLRYAALMKQESKQ